MKVFVGLAGLLIGAFLGGALLLLNPITLTQGRPASLSGAIRTFSWESGGGYRGLPLTPRGLLGDTTARDAAVAFEDPGIKYARVEVVRLTAEPGAPPVLGVKLTATARNNSLLRARLGTFTVWNLALPGRGTLLLSGSENFWAPLRDGLWSVVRGRGFRPGQERYPLPPVPGFGAPTIAGGTGEFVGVVGAFREEFAPTDAEPGEFTGHRQLHIAIE